jgi:N-acetylglucosaminyldiphosphoundecaprenol N-acetyl-beta-D-mannosaminyltransferase
VPDKAQTYRMSLLRETWLSQGATHESLKSSGEQRTRVRIAGVEVDVGTYASTTRQILRWAHARQSRYICVANVHMIMEARDARSYHAVLEQADLVTADGMPLVWVQRARGHRTAERVYGPTLMLEVCREAERQGTPVAFYGGTPPTVAQMKRCILERFPKLAIATLITPPFRHLCEDEHIRDLTALRESGARIIFVGLGCPKQERWMAERRGALNAVMIGVGAAFDFHAGSVRQAPLWIQRMGFEWLFRLAMEPQRLWRRYAWHNPRFIVAVLMEWLGLSGK